MTLNGKFQWRWTNPEATDLAVSPVFDTQSAALDWVRARDTGHVEVIYTDTAWKPVTP